MIAWSNLYFEYVRSSLDKVPHSELHDVLIVRIGSCCFFAQSKSPQHHLPISWHISYQTLCPFIVACGRVSCRINLVSIELHLVFVESCHPNQTKHCEKIEQNHSTLVFCSFFPAERRNYSTKILNSSPFEFIFHENQVNFISQSTNRSNPLKVPVNGTFMKLSSWASVRSSIWMWLCRVSQ